jgi:hypothetical protein
MLAALQDSPMRVAVALKRSVPAEFAVTTRTVKEPLGRRVTLVDRWTVRPLWRTTTVPPAVIALIVS